MASRFTASLLGAASLAAVTCCVSADTSVRTPDGPRRLGDLRIGDPVWSIDVATGQRLATQVVARRSAWRECVRLVHRTGALVCTPDHPIYAPETGAYEPASRWVEGIRTTLLLANDEFTEATPVLAVEAYAGVFEVVDITVAAAPHNFVAGDLVVHNKSIETSARGSVEGPAFALTVDEPIRRFEIRSCIAGMEPSAGDYASSMYISVTATSDPAPTAGELRYAVYFEAEGEVPVVDRPASTMVTVSLDTLAGTCAAPKAIVFERLDDLPDGAIGLTWYLDGQTEPPPGTSIDDTLDIEVEG